MSTEVKLRRGTTTEHSTFTGAAGEVTVDTTKNTLVVHDGATAGGHPLALEGSGGGGWQDVSQVAPASPSSYDDEFDGDTLDSSWVQVYPTGKQQTYTEKNGVLSVLCKSNGVNLNALLKSFTGLTYPLTIETAFRYLGPEQSYPGAGLIFSDGAVYGSGGSIQVTAFTIFGDTAFRSALEWFSQFNSRTGYQEINPSCVVGPYWYIRLKWVSTNTWSMYMSPDGITWLPVRENISVTLSPTHFGLVMSGMDSANADFVTTFEYFRVISG